MGNVDSSGMASLGGIGSGLKGRLYPDQLASGDKDEKPLRSACGEIQEKSGKLDVAFTRPITVDNENVF
jgi:hypothetical protein